MTAFLPPLLRHRVVLATLVVGVLGGVGPLEGDGTGEVRRSSVGGDSTSLSSVELPTGTLQAQRLHLPPSELGESELEEESSTDDLSLVGAHASRCPKSGASADLVTVVPDRLVAVASPLVVRARGPPSPVHSLPTGGVSDS